MFHELGGVVVPRSTLHEAVHNGFDDGSTVIVRISSSVNREGNVDADEGRTQMAVQPFSVAVASPRQRCPPFPDGDGCGPLIVMETSVTVGTPGFVGWLELDLDHMFDYTRTRRGGKMEDPSIIDVIIRIIGLTIMLSAFGLIGYTLNKVFGIKINDDDDTGEWEL